MAETELFKPSSASAVKAETISAPSPTVEKPTSMADAVVSQTKMAMSKFRVVSEDSPLWRIATDNGVSIRTLMELNHLTSVSAPDGTSIKLA